MSAIRTFIALSLGGLVSTISFATSTSSTGSADDPVSIDERLLETVAETPTAAGLRAWHDLLGGQPHVAGGPGDAAVIAAIAGAFEGMGLETEIWRFEPLLSRPIAASLTFVEEASTAGSGDSEPAADQARPSNRRRRGVVSLPLRERELLAGQVAAAEAAAAEAVTAASPDAAPADSTSAEAATPDAAAEQA